MCRTPCVTPYMYPSNQRYNHWFIILASKSLSLHESVQQTLRKSTRFPRYNQPIKDLALF